MNRKQRRTFTALYCRKKLRKLSAALFSAFDRQFIRDLYPARW